MKSLSTRAFVYGLLILIGAVFATPSFLPDSVTEKLPSWYAKQQISLGLDLRGGSQLLLAIDEKALLTQDSQRMRSEEHTSELQSRPHLVCRLLLEKKKKI